MGVLTDYFRAPDADAVVAAMTHDDGSPLAGPRSRFDGVDAKGLDPAVVLGWLLAVIESVPWRPDLADQTVVWPTTPPPGPAGPADDDDVWATGPWVTELADSVRDSLAAVPGTDLPRVVARWSRVPELDGASAEHLLPLAEALTGLARRARADGDRLYCWTSL